MLLACLLLFFNSSFAINYVSQVSGNWTTAATWLPVGVPGAGDNVTVQLGHTITMDGNSGSCRSLTINGACRWTQARTTNVGGGGVNISATGDILGVVAGILTTSGGLTINATLTSNTVTIRIQGGAGQNINGTGSLAILDITNPASANNNGNLTIRSAASGNGGLTNMANASLIIGGTLANNMLTASASPNTVTFNGTANQTINATTYHHLIISKPAASVASAGGAVTVNGNFTVTSGVYSFNNHAFTNNGATSTATVTGAVVFTSSAGAKTFRNISINATGIWIALASVNLTINGDFTNAGAFASNTGIYQFSGAGRTINCSVLTTFSHLRCSGSYTNNSTAALTVSTTFDGAGSFAQGINGMLNVGCASITVTTFNATATGNTVSYMGGANQNVRNGTSSTYHHLDIAGAGTKTLTAATTVNGNITISSTLDASVSNFNISLLGNWTNTGNPYIPRLSTVSLTGTAVQTITNAATEVFYNLVSATASTKMLGGPVQCNNNFTINAGATFDVSASNYTLSIMATFANNGTFVPRFGTVIMNGTTAQTITGSTVTTFYNLTQNNAAGVSLAVNANLRGSLTVLLGTFNTTGFTFLLISDATSTARIATIPAGADVSGNITMQRYINSTVTSWRLIACPVTGRTINDWNDDMITSGFPGSDYPNFAFCSMYTYDETKPFHRDTGWTKPTSIGNSISNSKGFLAYIGPVPIIMDVTGPPIKFAQTIPLTYTNNDVASNIGWNLVPNPYPSSIDWDAPTGWTKTNLNNAVYVWNPDLQQYASYVAGVGTNGGSNIIPSSQAFFVQAFAAGPGLSMTENVKSAVDQGFMKVLPQLQSSSPIYNLTLLFSGNNMNDQTVIRFDDNATWGFDGSMDAWKFPGGPNSPYIASVTDTNGDYSINSIPHIDSVITIPIRTKVGVSGTYTLRKDSISNLPSSACIMLEDLLTGVTTDLRNFNTYSFTISNTTVAPRFLLHIYPELTKEIVEPACNGSMNGAVIAMGAGAGPWNYVWKDSSGNVIRTMLNLSTADTLSNIGAGTYTIEVADPNSICGIVSETFVLVEPSTILSNAITANATCYGTNDASIMLSASGGTAPYTYSWSNTATTSGVTPLIPGTYSVVITDYNNCTAAFSYTVSEPAPVLASFTVSNDTAFLSQSGMVDFTNTSTGAASYEWHFFDSSMVYTTPDVTHYYDSTGTYQVMMVASNGPCSDTAWFTIVVVNDTAQQGNSVSDLQFASNINAYAVPGELVVEFGFDVNTCVDVGLWDLLGRSVMYTVDVCAGRETVRLPLPDGAEGIYLLRISDGINAWSQKVFLEKQ